MLLILIGVFIVGSRFSRLSFDYDKDKKKYIFLSILLFFGVTYGLQFLLGMILALTGNVAMVSEMATLLVIGFFTLLIGSLAVWLYYRFLEKKWKNETIDAKENDSLLDR